jgi:hypothetical protein
VAFGRKMAIFLQIELKAVNSIEKSDSYSLRIAPIRSIAMFHNLPAYIQSSTFSKNMLSHHFPFLKIYLL